MASGACSVSPIRLTGTSVRTCEIYSPSSLCLELPLMTRSLPRSHGPGAGFVSKTRPFPAINHATFSSHLEFTIHLYFDSLGTTEI